MSVLAISTSSSVASAAYVEDGRAIEVEHQPDPKRHAELLVDMVDHVVRRAGRTPDAIRAIAVDIGPGSFTGTRIGVATAQGIALALEIPLMGISSLLTMTSAARTSEACAAAIDARKSELYWAAFDARGETLVEPTLIPQDGLSSAIAQLEQRIGLHVSVVAPPELLTSADLKTRLVPSVAGRPDAADLGVFAWMKTNQATRYASVEPIYVRPPEISQPKRG